MDIILHYFAVLLRTINDWYAPIGVGWYIPPNQKHADFMFLGVLIIQALKYYIPFHITWSFILRAIKKGIAHVTSR